MANKLSTNDSIAAMIQHYLPIVYDDWDIITYTLDLSKNVHFYT